MKFKNALSAERVRELFYYCPGKGTLTRMVSSHGKARTGDVVGYTRSHRGLVVGVDGQQYYVHRIIFLWMTGRWPCYEVDHIDTDRTNNRWSNLREATHQQNMINTRRRLNNTSGIKGVSWRKSSGRWYVQISAQGKKIYLGLRDSKEAAAALYAEAAEKYHGEFARVA